MKTELPMKLVVQIPCLNEELTLAEMLDDMPGEIPDVDEILLVVVDDGSTDRTIEEAWLGGADHVVGHSRNRGLAQAFQTGLDASLALGADVIVTIDGDHQYSPMDIAPLVKPIVDGWADMVVGDRGTANLRHFSKLKRRLQAVGSYLTRLLLGLPVADAVCGFRAYSRDAAIKLQMVTSFSHCIETLVHAQARNLRVVSVPITAQAVLRPSRLMRSLPQFIWLQSMTLVRCLMLYHASLFFFVVSALSIGLSVAILIQLVLAAPLSWLDPGPPLVAALLLAGFGLSAFTSGLLADLLAINRQRIESVLEKTKQREGTFVTESRLGLLSDEVHQ